VVRSAGEDYYNHHDPAHSIDRLAESSVDGCSRPNNDNNIIFLPLPLSHDFSDNLSSSDNKQHRAYSVDREQESSADDFSFSPSDDHSDPHNHYNNDDDDRTYNNNDDDYVREHPTFRLMWN
jgi:hypothetical protein